jgi:hypothetical protein
VRNALAVLRQRDITESETITMRGYLIGITRTTRRFSVREYAPQIPENQRRVFKGRIDMSINVEGVQSGESFVLYDLIINSDVTYSDDTEPPEATYKITLISMTRIDDGS